MQGGIAMSTTVALKEIRSDKSSASQEAVRRLIKEAQITGQLPHPNIVPGDYGEAIVLDCGLAKQIGSADEETAPVVLTDDAQSPATNNYQPRMGWISG